MTDESIISDIVKEGEKFHVDDDPHYFDIPRGTFVAKSTKKVRRQKLPYLFTRNHKGHPYYYWTDGVKEVYLGTADAILRKVKG